MASNLTDLNYFHSLEAVNRVSEAQLQVSENLQFSDRMIKDINSFLATRFYTFTTSLYLYSTLSHVITRTKSDYLYMLNLDPVV